MLNNIEVIVKQSNGNLLRLIFEMTSVKIIVWKTQEDWKQTPDKFLSHDIPLFGHTISIYISF